MRPSTWLALVAFAAGLGTVTARAELYRYVDEDGQVHLSDDPSSLPRPHQAEVVPESGPGSVPVSVVPVPESTGAAGRASAGTARAAEPEPRCRLGLRDRKRVREGDDLVYTGEVVNSGTGRAAGVQVELADFDRDGARLRAARASLDRRNLEPGESTRFRLVIRQRERDEHRRGDEFSRSAFEASYVRCLPAASSATSR